MSRPPMLACSEPHEVPPCARDLRTPANVGCCEGLLRADPRARRILIVLSLGVALLNPWRAANAQSDTSQVARGTLQGWEEQVRLAIFDRGGSFHGRTSERGILQRFNEDMDSEYDLDVLSSVFSLSEQYQWYRRKNGARYWAGSIDELRLIQHGDFKASVPLGASWAADVWFTYQETLTAQRALLWLGFRRKLSDDDAHVFLRGTLQAVKPDADLELGVVLTPGGGTLTVAIAALDLFSDFNYQVLEVNPSIADSALDYTSHPFTLRAALDMPIGGHFRTEAYALFLTPTRLAVESQTRPGEGFVQDERYAYAGGLVEWEPSTRTALGLIATWVRASLGREPLSNGQPEDDFELTEETWRVGFYAIHNFPNRFALEAWLGRVWRMEDRLRPDTAMAPDTNYEDRTWAGRNSFIYQTPRGFRAELGLDFTARETSGSTPVPTLSPLGRNNFRLRADFGWHFGQRAFFLLGANLDLDGGSFDGAHGRFMLNW